MKKSVGSEFYQAFGRVKGYPLTFFCKGLSIVLLVLDPDTSIRFKYIVPLGVLLLLILAGTIDFGFHCFSKITKKIPSVKQGLDPPPLCQVSETWSLVLGTEENNIFRDSKMLKP